MDQETIEMNKLIAAFLGGEVREIYRIRDTSFIAWCGDVAKQYRHEKMGIRIGDCIDERQLKFHESWEWIMPAVYKIEDVEVRGMSFDVWISKHSIDILYSRPGHSIRKEVKGCRIVFEDPEEKLKHLHQCICNFIKWYNEQHNNTTEPTTGNGAL